MLKKYKYPLLFVAAILLSYLTNTFLYQRDSTGPHLATLFAGLSAIIIAVMLYRTGLLIRALSANAFYTEKLQSESGSLWYQLCFISHGSVKTAGLDKLLAI